MVKIKRQKHLTRSPIIYGGDLPISPDTNSEYISYHNEVNLNDYDYQKVITESERTLFELNTPREIKKKLLFLLGGFATVECYKLLKKFFENGNSELKPWATLAMQDLRFKIENEIREEEMDMIMTGLGGMNNKLRFMVVVSSKAGKPLTVTHKRIIEKELYKTAKQHDSEVEQIEFGRNYALITILISFEVAPQTPMDALLDVVSTKRHILRYHFMIVNTHKITKKEIEEYLNLDEVRKL
ncbi:MAG: hypothetical protein UV61_C0003G0055 [Candidatus Gottesmanbacteria bacterium GW2011_GWB1_43_11]|nr:MAG: hypothetical protein UV04_C0002G0056 [Candidatus Gottesmanbacteria bacterium GW2011_GWA2_42_16]KKS56158.1 MAG: hypothetical protein UV17_C0002G0055 [Candidatus Gottesmanbacteria bacterium GW2011_GWA1_42_26]KKS82479.1 MAG: hypothetical protein UV55_C0002G0057 [Candidatus Gottesmanbacteria bacterium GW2011_GWC1_43_10]KKS87202.1 MAG: hypothetical protein UV61_C0003G0055 [Candidatus Gottesmanbacteria bacterium GW2011_GWB1_43_11]OGG08477.1 MAG: hypothetical protein A2699_05290 [Candidatus Go